MRDAERDGLVARIRQLGHRRAADDRSPSAAPAPDLEPLASLEARVAHLEQLLEGLQDSVHREAERHAKMIAELQERTQPGQISAALADDARSRGL